MAELDSEYSPGWGEIVLLDPTVMKYFEYLKDWILEVHPGPLIYGHGVYTWDGTYFYRQERRP